MIEIGDMVYYRGEKWEVYDISPKATKVAIKIKTNFKVSAIANVKPIYRNGVKVTVCN